MKRNNDTILYKGSSGISIAEVKTVLHESSLDLGTLCRSNNINPWAKYKPFRNSALWFANAKAHTDALAAVHYGFNFVNIGGFYIDQQSIPCWENEYEKANGPYRIFDFVDLTADSQNGYNHNAVPPIGVVFPESVRQEQTIIMIRKNTGVQGWDSGTCISLGEIFPSQYQNYKFAVACIYGGTINILVTDKTVGSFVSGSDTTYSIGFAGLSDGGIPVLPMLSGSGPVYDTNTVTLKVYLEGSLSAGVYTNRGTSSTISLDMLQGMSIASKVYHELQSIDGMTATLAITGTSVSTGSQYVKGYHLTSATLTLNPGPYWGDDITGRTTVNVAVNVSSNAAYWLMSSSSTPSTDWEYSSGSVAQLSTASNNFTQVGLKSSDVNKVAVAFSTNQSDGSTHLLKESYFFVSAGGGNEKLIFSGFCFPGSDLSRTGLQVPFTNTVEIPL